MNRAAMVMTVTLGMALPSHAQVEAARKASFVRDPSGSRTLAWEIGVQLWTFGPYTFPEQLEQAKALGVDYIETGPKIVFTKKTDELKTHEMTPEQQSRVKATLAEYGLTVKQTYAHSPPNQNAWRKVFEFCQVFGADTIVAEPREEHYDFLESMCRQYGVRIAVHNHPSLTNRYYHPDRVLAQIGKRGPRLGFNPDVGHWMRMGINPLEQLKRREVRNRLMTFHINDVETVGTSKSPHVPLGTGAGDMRAVLQHLAESGFKGRFTLEYGNWRRNFGQCRESVQFIDNTAREIVARTTGE